MRVLGIDPGYAIVGWGVVEYIGNRFTPGDFGAVTTPAGMPFEQRLAAVLQRCDGVGNVTALLSETGAVIVCDGADDAAVRLSVIKAVEAFTGFSSDSIQVIKTAPNIGG